MPDIKSMTNDELEAYIKKKRRPGISYEQALFYEIQASWWVSWVSIDWMRDIAARYFAWKVRRKMRRIRSY